MRQLLHPVLVLLSLLLLLVATPSGEARKCSWIAGHDDVVNSFQSSSGICSHKKLHDKLLRQNTHEFSSAKHETGADSGYQWQVFHLARPLLMTAVTLFAKTDEFRSGPFRGRPYTLRHQIMNVQVWTAAVAVDFGDTALDPRNCNSAAIGSTFRRHRSLFKECGSTPAPRGYSIPTRFYPSHIRSSHNYNLAVQCVARVKTLLFRRSTSNHHLLHDIGVMHVRAFELNATEISISVNGSTGPTVTVNRGDTIQVKCSSACSVQPHTLQLCQPNGSCTNSSSTVAAVTLSSAAAQHKGTFWCKLIGAGGGSVNKTIQLVLLHGPDSLSISVNGSVTACTQKEMPQLTFNFTSSAANPAVGRHLCSFTLNGTFVGVEVTGPLVHEADGTVTSRWMLRHSVSMYGEHVIRCSAVQLLHWNVAVTFATTHHDKKWRCDADRLLIRRGHVISSWQSSFGAGAACFWDRDESAVAAAAGSSGGRYFCSDGGDGADGGFQWLVLQLRERLSVSSVTLCGRNGVGCDGCAAEFNRHNRVQVWTSPEAMDFGDNHCTSDNISSTFQQHKDSFQLCGITNSVAPPTPGLNLTVHCAAKVKTLLLRRRVDISESDLIDSNLFDSFMSFSDVQLNITELPSLTSNAGATEAGPKR